jgi:hypothetical protein
LFFFTDSLQIEIGFHPQRIAQWSIRRRLLRQGD